MRRNLLFGLVALFLLFNFRFTVVNAQQLPNSGFENWEYDALNQWKDGQRPVGWNTSNIKKTVVGVTAGANMVFPDGGAHSGTYCAKAINTEVGAAGITETSPAWFTMGKPWSYIDGLNTGSATAGTDGGIQFTYRPDTIAVWIKRTASGNENAHIIFYSWKGTSQGDSYKAKNGNCSSTTHYDEESDIRQLTDANSCKTTVLATQVAEAMWRSKETFSNWTEVKIPIKYLTNDKPEKCNVIISAANYPNFRANSVELGAAIWADDIRLIYSSGVDEIYVDGRKKLSCVSGQFDYTCSMGKTATSVGEITLKRSGRYLDPSEYTINKGAIGEITSITVKAEDGSSESTYNVMFAAAMSSNPNLGDILVDGLSIAGFNPLITSYSLELPFGTTNYPTIEAVLAEDGQRAEVQMPSVFPGTVKISSIAPDGTTKKEYSIVFTVGALIDNTLTDISLDGQTIPGFNPTKNNYTIELPLGTTETPKLGYTTAYPNDHDIVVDNKGISGGIEIKVTPKGTTLTRTYKIKFVVTESTNSKLAAITIDGELIEGFNPELFTYTVNLPIGTTDLPVVSFEKGDPYQTVTIEQGGFETPTKITVKSQSGAQSIYRINFVIAQSSISTLADIQLDGVSIEGFDPAKTSYKIELGQGVTVAPKITYTKGDEYQSVTLTEGGISGISRIVVQAQSGAVTTYTIEFVVVKSSNSTVKAIFLDGVLLEGFASDVTTYSISLPRGTTKLPEITWTPGDASQTIRKVDGGVSGETKITVKAQTGDVTIYSIFFSVETNSNVNLKDIKIGGVSVEGFSSEILEYSIELPAGTIVLPEIICEKGDESQTVSITRGGVNGVTEILVRAEDGTTRVYKITFSVQKSENAFLKMIYVDGVALADFEKEKFDYNYVLTSAVTECPEITIDKEDGQNVSITVPRVTGVVRIEVTPESGSKNVYTININYPQSSNSKLAEVLVDGEQIIGWNPDVTDYVLQITDKKIPVVTYVQGDDKQKVVVETNSITGDTKFIVKAENGRVTTYSIRFERVKSSVSNLLDLQVGGVSIFEANKNDYDYILPQGTEVRPMITYVKGDDNQNVTLIAPVLEGKAEIIVVSEDATATTTYTIDFAFQPSSNTDLEKIVLTQRAVNYEKELTTLDFGLSSVALIDGGIISDTVVIDWIRGVVAPTITYVEEEEQQMVAFADAGLNGAEILVVAEDGSQREYVIRYNIVKTDIAQLQDLQIYDEENHRFVPISGFKYDHYVYDIKLPWRTKTEPVLNPVAMLPNQTIKVMYGGVNGATNIEVTAEDGVSTQIYTVNFSVEKSSLATLDAIYYTIDNNSQELPNFESNKFEYVVELPYGTINTPLLTWDLGTQDGKVVTEQIVEYRAGNIYQPSEIKVIAEDGTENTYVVNYKVVNSVKPNVLTMVSVGNEPVIMEDGVFDYEVELPYGTTELPEITVLKSYPEQRVIVTSKGLLGTTKIEVYSNKSVEDKVVYNLKYRVSKVSPASLESITIDGVKIPNFDPEETTYIFNVTTPPTLVEAEPIDGAELVEDPIYNAHKAEFKVTGDAGNDEKTYMVYFHYGEEKIPNGTFDQWGKARYNNANKPLGWTVPADVADEYIYEIPLVGTDIIYNTGSEVSDSTSFTKVYLQTCFGASLNGSVPGMMTLGDMALSLDQNGNSKSSVSGGISFHNTPEKICLDYKPIHAQKISEWKLLLSIGSSSNMKMNEFSGKYTNLNVWQKLEENIKYNVGEEVEMMNITINSAHSTNAKDLNGEYSSGLAIDNLRFYYNNLLSSIVIDGVALYGFRAENFEYTYTIDAERTTLPEISVIGQVADQQHRISWGDDINGERIATITSMAEDGTSVDYKIKFVHEKSTNKLLKGLKINGVLVDNFEPNKFEYTYVVPNMTRRVPDIEAIAANYNQNIIYTIAGTSSVTIAVMAENVSHRSIYKINFVEEKNNITALKNVILDGYALEYDETITSYRIDVAADAIVPYIYFEKTSEGQSVDLSVDNNVAIFNVTAQDGETKGEYIINFVRPEVISTAQLSNIILNDYQIDGFAIDNYNYVHNIEKEPLKSIYYEKVLSSDVVTYIITPDSVLLRVNSADGSVKNNYRIIYDIPKSSDATLESLTINYRPIEGFVPALTDYPVEVERNEFPHIAAKAYDIDATISVDYVVNETNERTFLFEVESEDETKVITKVRMFTLKETSTELAGIFFNGEELRENGEEYTSSSVYIPEITEYSIKLHSVSPKMEQPTMPNITAIAGTYGQNVVIEQGGIDGDTYITVVSESGAETTYTLKFTPERSSNVYLNDLLLDYETIKGFQPKRYFYQIKLQKGSNMPIVSWQAADAFQIVEVKEYEDRLDVVVTAEDGTSETYQIEIEWLPSNETNIEAILSDGELLEGFDPTIYDYFFDLPVGTMVEPMLKIVAGADGQSISIVSGGVNGTTTISVTAPDGVTKRDYRIHYSLLMSENNKLNMIYLDGEPLEGFISDLRDYTILLPMGKDNPFVTWETSDDYQTVTREIRDDGTVILKVIPQREELYYEYIVRFEKVMSKNATLKSIEVDGEVISGFAPNKFTYLIDLPVGTESVPYISYTKAEDVQSVDYIEPETLADVATIKVIAQDSSYTSTYYVAFNRLLSEVDTLKTIFVGGIPLENFDADSSEYIIVLPYGTQELPNIEYEQGDAYQTIEVIKEDLRSIIVVTAENGKRRSYTVKFEIEKSANSLLKAIYSNGKLIESFDSEVFEYEIILPYGETTLPIFSYDLLEPMQSVKYQPAISVTDTAIFEVTAENGIDKSVYYIFFKTIESDNAFLANIFIGDEPLTKYAQSFESDKSFSSEEFIYNIIFPYGTEALPEITWVGQVDDYASIVISGDSVRGKTIITVTSADGYNVSDYELNFDVRKSDNAYLKSLLIKDVEFKFDSTIFEYVVTFPIGTDTTSLPAVEDLVYEQVLPTQTVVVSQNSPTELVVLVTAEDGIAMNVYQIKFEILLSNNTLLKDLKVSGVSIANFSSTQYEYTYMLFPGAAVPEVEFEKAEESQNVDITYGNVDEPTFIYVEAEDGSIGTYIINFVTTNRNPGDQPSYDDVAWTSLGDGYFKASSVRSNVKVMISQANGTPIVIEEVGLVDPNNDIRLPHDGGTVIYLPNNRQIYIYTFVYDNKVIASGKFVR